MGRRELDTTARLIGFDLIPISNMFCEKNEIGSKSRSSLTEGDMEAARLQF